MPYDLISIDPGLTGTGWALWDVASGLVSHGVIRPPTSLTRTSKRLYIADNLTRSNTYQAIIEIPEGWSRSAKSSASMLSGDLLALAALCGTIEYRLCAVNKVTNFNLVTPREWKGQLTKKAVIARIRRELGDIKLRDHEADAVGLGLFFFEKF